MTKLKYLKKTELSMILLVAVAWSLLAYASAFYFPQVYGLVLLPTSFFAAIVFLVVKKIGSVALLFSITGIMTLPVPFLGVLGPDKILIFVSTGIIFELVAHANKNILNAAVAGTVSNAAVPWLILWLGKTQLPAGLENAVLNFTFVSSILGLTGSLAGLFVWYKIKNSKTILKSEYG
ncbi:MAG: hypothetical protein HYT71_04170 [Candidatus Aenigmarchaeota archaeon]|nr:hypothetical protein [Candidatus Aenigmarchaeota archaeon]